MSQRKQQILVLLVAILFITVANTYDCPEDCHCAVINGTQPYNHAKCSSTEGLFKVKNLPLHSLDLSHAGITRIKNHLETYRVLDSIDLSNNQLSEIGRIGHRVRTLNLKHNKITSGKLSKIPHHIQNLDLSYNEITYLPTELRQLTELRTLELVGNKIMCSCETLDVRNWLQQQYVFTKNPITCSGPQKAKGKSWLQVKQSEICEYEKQVNGVDDNENDLMLGDEPIDDGEDELGKDFMRVEKKNDENDDQSMIDAVEGSGDLSVRNMPMVLASSQNSSTLKPDEDEEDGSGSGMGIGIINLNEHIEPDNLDGDDDVETSSPTIAEPVESVISSSDDVFAGKGLGIAEFEETSEPIIVTSDHPGNLAAIFNQPEAESESEATKNNGDDSDVQNADMRLPDNELSQAKSGDDKGTFILLGIILFIIVGLIVFVAIKRRSRGRSHDFDAENQRTTELLDMDKKNPGKPVNRNGHTEQLPLIGNDKPKAEIEKPMNGNNKRIPYDDGTDKKIQEPLLQSENSQPTENESNNNLPEKPKPTDTIPVHTIISPRYPPPKSPRASKQNGNVNDNDDVFLPSSPKSGRYSPVYSPETGKVKIKLTETPKPKTPMLVTRSKSNAGEIITTPVLSNNSHPEVHNNYLTTNGDNNDHN